MQLANGKPLVSLIAETAVDIRYTNWKGETGDRRIVPIRMFFGCCQFHPEYQWLVEAYDVGKNDNRTFAMKDIHEWKPLPPGTVL